MTQTGQFRHRLGSDGPGAGIGGGSYGPGAGTGGGPAGRERGPGTGPAGRGWRRGWSGRAQGT
jgi:hypothetical protein